MTDYDERARGGVIIVMTAEASIIHVGRDAPISFRVTGIKRMTSRRIQG